MISAPLVSQSLESAILIGRITDKTTDEPLIGTNVYIANSTLGSETDKNGFFAIIGVPFGDHQLIVSYIGYSVIKQKIKVSKKEYFNLDFKLESNTFSLQEIVISGEKEKDWNKNLKKFTNEFLGNTNNAQESEIINPEVLDFTINEDSGELNVQASNLLQIINNALGYRIDFLLEEFSINGNVRKIMGIPTFKPLVPKNKKELKKWEDNRIKAYLGSLKHFLASLSAGKLESQGFYILSMPRLPLSLSDPYQQVNPDSLISNTIYSNEKELRFRNYLQIVYTKEKIENRYLFSVPRNSQEFVLVKDNRVMTHSYQTSWIKLNYSNARINQNGHMFNPYEMAISGYLTWERVAEMLPIEFIQDMYMTLFNYESALSNESENIDLSQLNIKDSKIEELILRNDNRMFFDEGQKLKEKGLLKDAFEMWYYGKKAYEIQGKTDPRLGLEYIRNVVENNERDLYENATELYLWAFSDGSLETHTDIILEEVNRIKPLLEDNEKKIWEELISNKDALILNKIRGFWIEKDLTPATALNERLIEHWERIVYARKNFTRNQRSPYQTDDRGTIYVQYGEPDKKHSGTLGDDVAELSRLYQDIDNLNPNEVDTIYRGSFGLRNVKVNPTQILGVQLNTQYEIWIYQDLLNEDKGIFVFGSSGSSRFGLMNSVEDLIPSQTFSKRNELWIVKRINGREVRFPFSPASMIQLMYYHELMFVDDFFATRYNELESVWNDNVFGSTGIPPNPGITMANSRRYLYRDTMDPVKRFAPREKTEFEIIPVIIDHSLIRSLDSDNNPMVTLVAMSKPDVGVYDEINDLIRESVVNAHYDPIHSLIIRDDNWNEVERYTRTKLDPIYHLSAYILDYENKENSMVLAAEAKIDVSLPGDSVSSIPVPFLGKVNVALSQPLESDKSTLEVSDLIAGIKTPVVIDSSQYPYPVIPLKEIQQNEYLEIYLEIYHLMTGNNDVAQYQITFRLESQTKQGILTRLFQKKEKDGISISSNFDRKGNRSKEHIAFDVSDLEPAEYEFQVTVTDLLSGQVKIRMGNIRITK